MKQVTADIGEKTDLAEARANDIERVLKLLEGWLPQTVAPLWEPGSKDSEKPAPVTERPAAKTAGLGGDVASLPDQPSTLNDQPTPPPTCHF